MNTCSKCGATVHEHDLFCSNCYEKIEKNQPTLFCQNCGAQADNDAVFCSNCGFSFNTHVNYVNQPSQNANYPDAPAVYQNTGANYNKNTTLPPDVNTDYGSGYPLPTSDTDATTKKSKAPAIIITILSILLVAAIGVLVFFMLNNDKSQNSSTKGNNTSNASKNASNSEGVEKNTDHKSEEDDTQNTEALPNLNQVIDEFISSRVSASDISVSIIDNKSDKAYMSEYSDTKYVAWGNYLPVYLAYTNRQSYNSDVADGIMSNDVSVCNECANEAINAFGSPNAITNSIRSKYGAFNTSYGRFFGDVNATTDNYTTADDAVSFLYQLNDNGEFSKLSYNLADFNITAPYNVNIYAHAGTENRNVRDELNLYAIIKGENVDYCIAIMSKNSAGEYISELLEFINDEMELRANE